MLTKYVHCPKKNRYALALQVFVWMLGCIGCVSQPGSERKRECKVMGLCPQLQKLS